MKGTEQSAAGWRKGESGGPQLVRAREINSGCASTAVVCAAQARVPGGVCGANDGALREYAWRQK